MEAVENIFLKENALGLTEILLIIVIGLLFFGPYPLKVWVKELKKPKTIELSPRDVKDLSEETK